MIATSTWDNVVDVILGVTILMIICSITFAIVLGAGMLYFTIFPQTKEEKDGH